MSVCAHESCTCEAPAGEEYCSPFCQEYPQAEECHCHHGSCEAPHHH